MLTFWWLGIRASTKERSTGWTMKFVFFIFLCLSLRRFNCVVHLCTSRKIFQTLPLGQWDKNLRPIFRPYPPLTLEALSNLATIGDRSLGNEQGWWLPDFRLWFREKRDCPLCREFTILSDEYPEVTLNGSQNWTGSDGSPEARIIEARRQFPAKFCSNPFLFLILLITRFL
jgi:hypothetical protein